MIRKLFPADYEVRRRRIWRIVELMAAVEALVGIAHVFALFGVPITPDVLRILLIIAGIAIAVLIYPVILIGMNIREIGKNVKEEE